KFAYRYGATRLTSLLFLPPRLPAVYQTLVPFARLAQSRGENPALNEAAEVQAWSEFQLSYLKDNATRARYACTLPSSTFMSNFTISAMRRSRSVPAAVSTAFFAASSQDFVLVPITSTIL